MRIGFVPAIFAGVALALPYVLYAGRVRKSRSVFGIGLVVAAAVYVAFAVFAGAFREALIEGCGVVLFGGIAVLGMRRSSWFLALGWAGHVAWDLLLHPLDHSSYAPWWYPMACIGFDLLVAGAIVGGSWLRPKAGSSIFIGILLLLCACSRREPSQVRTERPVPGPFRISSDVTAPVLIERVEPVFPETVHRRGGVIVLESVVAEEGSVTAVKVLRGEDDSLAPYVVEAVKQWRFRPATRNGKPVAVYYNLSVNIDVR